MKGHSWFWLTFLTWCLIGTMAAWALITSSSDGDLQLVAKFDISINGTTEPNRIQVTSEPLDRSLAEMTQRWEKEGWTPLPKGLDFISALLDLPPQYARSLDPLAKLVVFQDKGKQKFRILGLWRDEANGRTYQWTAELPKGALHPSDPSRLPFPFKPPTRAIDVVSVNTGKVDVLGWKEGPGKDPERTLGLCCSSQGFDQKPLSRNGQESAFLLQRGSVKLLAVVDPRDRTMALVRLE